MKRTSNSNKSSLIHLFFLGSPLILLIFLQVHSAPTVYGPSPTNPNREVGGSLLQTAARDKTIRTIEVDQSKTVQKNAKKLIVIDYNPPSAEDTTFCPVEAESSNNQTVQKIVKGPIVIDYNLTSGLVVVY